MPVANWYPDPDSNSQLRYWNGSAWTAHYALLPPPPAEETALTALPGADTTVSDANWRFTPPAGSSVGEVSSSRRSLRPGEYLIGLGAVALVAAALVFLRKIWPSLGASGQIGVLLLLVAVQVAASLLAVSKIRVLGESLAASSGVTILLASSWAWIQFDGTAKYFPILPYFLALVHVLLLLAPVAYRARTWQYTAFLSVLVGVLSLLAAPLPHLWALLGALVGLGISRRLRKGLADKLGALHAIAASVYALVSAFNESPGRYEGYVVAGVVASLMYATSHLWKGDGDFNVSLEVQSPASLSKHSLFMSVWIVSLITLICTGLTRVLPISASGSTGGSLIADTTLGDRLIFALLAIAVSVLVYRRPSPIPVHITGQATDGKGHTSSKRWLAIALFFVALAQLGRKAVLIPSLNFLQEVSSTVAEFIGDVYVTIGPGYILLTVGVAIMVYSLRFKKINSGFIGAATAAIGWGTLVDTRLSDTLDMFPAPEVYTLPSALLFAAVWYTSRRTGSSSSKPGIPASALALVPSAVEVLDASGASNLRFTILVGACIVLLIIGLQRRLCAFVYPTVPILLLLFVSRALGLLGDSWVTLAVASIMLLVAGSFFEKMRERVQAARTYLAALR